MVDLAPYLWAAGGLGLYAIGAFTLLIVLSWALQVVLILRDRCAERARLEADTLLALKSKADAMAAHAVEYDLPAMPWYQLAAYWGRVADYTAPEPEPEREPKFEPVPLVTRGPASDDARDHEPGPAFDLDAFVERTKRQYFGEVKKNTGWERNPDKTWTAPSGRRYYPDSLPALTTHERLADEHARIQRTKMPEPEVLNVTWQLKGTDEDLHVFRALGRHGVQVSHDEATQTAHLRGAASAIQAAEADYRAGWEKRRGKDRGPQKASVRRGRRKGVAYDRAVHEVKPPGLEARHREKWMDF